MNKKTNYPSLLSYNMSKIRGYNNNLERKLRKEMRARGIYGYRIDDKSVIGTPDICYKGLKIAIFVDGDFWHGFDWDKRKCQLTTLNKTFWINKIERNMERDRQITYALEQNGWTVLRFWEHEINQDSQACVQRIEEQVKFKRLLFVFKPL